jgi:hypothetical protein
MLGVNDVSQGLRPVPLPGPSTFLGKTGWAAIRPAAALALPGGRTRFDQSPADS